MKRIIKKIAPRFVLNYYINFRNNRNLQMYLQSNKGDNVECPICSSKYTEFGTIGLVPRKNAKCPKCGSLERHRLLWKYFIEKTDLFKANHKIKLLHFAPERMFYNVFSTYQNIEYYPCDISPKSYPYVGNVKVFKADITNIPFEENYFDVILCNHVLEHIPDDMAAMSELFRVLKKDGWAVLQVPIDYTREITYEDFSITSPDGREHAFGQNDHVRWYGQDYKNRLKKAGFSVQEDDFVKSFSTDDLFRYGLMESELIYYCTK